MLLVFWLWARTLTFTQKKWDNNKCKESPFNNMIPLHVILLPTLEAHLPMLHLEQSRCKECLQSPLMPSAFSLLQCNKFRPVRIFLSLHWQVRSESLNMLRVISTKASYGFKFVFGSMMQRQLLSFPLSSMVSSQLLTFYICVELVALSN